MLADTSNGSRMIWITRKMGIPLNLETKSDPHPLRLRADEESKALFTHALKTLKVSIPSEVEDMKDKIARTCVGLPLLILKFAEEALT